MSDVKPRSLAAAIDEIIEREGYAGIRMLRMAGPAVETQCPDWGSIVAYVDNPEPEILKLAPLGVGIDSLVSWIEPWLEDTPEDGPGFEVRVETWAGQDFEEVDYGE